MENDNTRALWRTTQAFAWMVWRNRDFVDSLSMPLRNGKIRNTPDAFLNGPAGAKPAGSWEAYYDQFIDHVQKGKVRVFARVNAETLQRQITTPELQGFEFWWTGDSEVVWHVGSAVLHEPTMDATDLITCFPPDGPTPESQALAPNEESNKAAVKGRSIIDKDHLIHMAKLAKEDPGLSVAALANDAIKVLGYPRNTRSDLNAVDRLRRRYRGWHTKKNPD